MSLPIVLRTEARDEFDDAFDRYEGERPGLGVAFAERVHELFDRIAVNPRSHEVAFREVRRAVVQRFPYCVFYRADKSRVLVLAVFHAKRDPKIWKTRV